MANTDWIDQLCKIWGEIDIGKKSVRSFLIYERAEYPEKIAPEDIPCVLTRITNARIEYDAGQAWGYWSGLSEFHVTADSAMSKLPEAMLWYARIYIKAAAYFFLNGLVTQFHLLSEEGSPSIEGPLELQFANEVPHWGFVVNWFVKENLSGEITLTDPSM